MGCKDINILIAEDEEYLQNGYVSMLSPISVNIFVAQNGEDAWNIIENKSDIDIVLSDIKMPKMDGLQLIEKISKSKPHILTLLITSNRNFENMEIALSCNVFDFLDKPMNSKLLLHKINNAIERILDKRRLMLNTRNDACSRFALDIIHHWRQPLNNVALSNQALKIYFESCKNNSDKKDCLEILNKSDKLLEMLSMLIDMQVSPSLILEKFKIGNIIKDEVNRILSVRRYNSISISLDLDNALCINGNKNALLEVVNILLQNSIDSLLNKSACNNSKFFPSIDVTLTINSKNAILTICDNGEGINNDIYYQIFDPFFSTKSKECGRGLGLYRARMIVRQIFSGDILFTSSNTLTIFKITIPV